MRALVGLSVGLAYVGLSCSSTPTSAPAPQTAPPLFAGEYCDASNTAPLKITFDPPNVVLAPNQTRPVVVTVEPDLCSPATLTFASGNVAYVATPPSAIVDLRHPTFGFTVTGAAPGATSITVNLSSPSGHAALPVTVRDGAAPTCVPTAGVPAPQEISAAQPLVHGTGALASASISVPPGAFTRTDWLAIPPFPAQISCAASDATPLDLTKTAPGDLLAIGPAVTFTGGAPLPQNQSLRRELDFAIPVNPATIPAAGRMRHLQVLYQGPMIKTPRAIPIANPRIEQVANQDSYVLKFSSPWFGTFQAAFPRAAGTQHRTRHLTHRAVIGFSMGAAGAASFGLRHHDQFDVIGPMGGPGDWNWLLWFLNKYTLAGFCPASQPNCATYAPDQYPIAETYVHTEDWNHWWYENGNGNGGRFDRASYVQIFEDLALMSGDPNGENPDPTLSFFPGGLRASDPFVKGMATGLPPGIDCRITVDPIDGDPNEALQQQWQSQCTASRCDPKNTWIAPHGYFDATYNPEGAYPVISFCDGNSVGASPYENGWAPPTQSTEIPVDLALAVDLNGNGVRDANEPIISQAYEPWQDTGVDGLPDEREPGYDPIKNPDPSQDDYDYQLNPNGTENNHHYDTGEPFQDYGIDGVPGTKQIAQGGYDFGEGDGKFTLTDGLKNFYAVDPHSILHQWQTNIPAGPMTDDEMLRFDIWSDGGVRDLFNFAAVANHLVGSIGSRHAADGSPLRSTAFYDGFQNLPGEDPTQPDSFAPDSVAWADVVDSPMVRYGTIDATPAQIEQGDGQHVGTGAQLLYRLESSLYFTGQHWPDADRRLTELTRTNPETSTINVLGSACEIVGQCTTNFTGPKTKRTGPIVIQVPPGYALADNVQRNVRYPVVYVLHGYGQSPSDLEPVAVVSTNFMNDELHSSATRLPKFILVYVDGRCRVSTDGRPECIQGTFYLDSNRADGAHMDSWFDEVVDYVDANYRTMPASDIDVVE